MSTILDLITSGNPIVSIVGEVAGKLINRLWPDPILHAKERAAAELELLKVTQEDKLDERAKDTQLLLGQIAVNEADAKSGNAFQANWRPSVGWICAGGLGYSTIIEPFSRFVATVVFKYSGSFPLIDTTLTMQVLIGLLGLGVMRSYDKKQGTAAEK